MPILKSQHQLTQYSFFATLKSMMDEIVAKYGWQKVGAVLVGISVLLLVFVIVSFADIDKKANEEQKKKSENNEVAQTSVRKINPFAQSGEGLKTLSNQYFLVLYPENFETEEYTDNSNSLASVKLSDKKSNAKVEVVALNKDNNISQMGKVYETMGLQKREFRHFLGNATEYSGTVGSSKLHQKVVFLTKGDTNIRFIGTYTDDQSDNLLDQMFSDIVLSLR